MTLTLTLALTLALALALALAPTLTIAGADNRADSRRVRRATLGPGQGGGAHAGDAAVRPSSR